MPPTPASLLTAVVDERLSDAPEPPRASPSTALDELARWAAQLCGAEFATVSQATRTRWVKAAAPCPLPDADGTEALRRHAMASDGAVLVVQDASADPRFALDAWVRGAPHLRFFAAVQVALPNGDTSACLCVASRLPRTLDAAQEESLRTLARQCATLLALEARVQRAETSASMQAAAAHAAERALAENRELLDLVLRGGNLGLWDLHVPTGHWRINDRERLMLGYSAEEATPDSLTWQSLVHPEDLQAVGKAFDRHLRGETAYCEVVHRLRHKDGHYIWTLHRSVAVERDESGQPVRVVGTHMNVTAQREAEEEKRKNGERLTLALSGGDIGLWDLDVPSGKTTYNAQWWRMFGYAADEIPVVDGLWKSIVHPDDYEAGQVGLLRHLNGETPMYEGEVRVRHKDGHWLWVQNRAKVMERDAAGAPLRIVGVNLNITAQKENVLALERVRDLLDRTSALAKVGGWEIDPVTRAMTWSAELYRMHDVAPGWQPTMEKAIAFYLPEARAGMVDSISAALAQGSGWNLELPLLTAAGRQIWVRMLGQVELQGSVVRRVAGTLQDITETKKIRERLQEEQHRLRGLTDNVPALLTELDLDERVVFCNGRYRTWLGIEPADAIGQPIREVVGHALHDQRKPLLARAFAGETLSFEQTAQLVIGERVLQTTYLPQRDADGRVTGLYILANDVTDLKQKQLQLDALAREDALTRLPNRRSFEERIEDAMARAKRTGVPLCLAYLDIDHFKRINDTLGHAGGDAVLVEFASRLRAAVRRTDTPARHAGDEFVVLLEGIAHARDAEHVGAKILSAMRAPFQVLGRQLTVTTSIGLAVSGAGEEDVASLLARADGALYAAKHNGRDRLATAAPLPPRSPD